MIGIRKDISIKVGALGRISFRKGRYLYIGSAQNNLAKRIQRHYTKDKNKRWHIDHLLDHDDVDLKTYLYSESGKQEECRIASLLSETQEPVKGFGCSDCSCPSHLFRIEDLKTDDLHMKSEFDNDAPYKP